MTSHPLDREGIDDARPRLAFAVDGKSNSTQTTRIVSDEIHEESKIPYCSLLSYLLSRLHLSRLLKANMLMSTGAEMPSSQE